MSDSDSETPKDISPDKIKEEIQLIGTVLPQLTNMMALNHAQLYGTTFPQPPSGITQPNPYFSTPTVNFPQQPSFPYGGNQFGNLPTAIIPVPNMFGMPLQPTQIPQAPMHLQQSSQFQQMPFAPPQQTPFAPPQSQQTSFGLPQQLPFPSDPQQMPNLFNADSTFNGSEGTVPMTVSKHVTVKKTVKIGGREVEKKMFEYKE